MTERTCIEPYDGGIHYSEDGGKSWCDLPANAVVSMNLWGLHTSLCPRPQRPGLRRVFEGENLPVNPLKCEYYLPAVVTAALQRGEADVHVLTSADKWHGITYREDKPELVAALKQMSEVGCTRPTSCSDAYAEGRCAQYFTVTLLYLRRMSGIIKSVNRIIRLSKLL